MDWSDVGAALGKGAPLLTSLITGNIPGAVMAGANLLASAFNTDAEPDAVMAAIKADPQAAARIAEVESNNKVELQRLAVTAEANRLTAETARVEQEVRDRGSARDRDTAITASGKHNYRADILAFLACAGLLACVFFIARDAGLPERAVNAIMFVAGVFASAVRDVFSFEFGSSRSSQDKNELLVGGARR